LQRVARSSDVAHVVSNLFLFTNNIPRH